MRIALIADTFPPLRTSGAVQISHLSREFSRQGHSVCVILPAPNQRQPWLLDEFDGVEVLRLRAPRTKDISYVRRTISEFLMPFAMLRNLRKSPLASEIWDGVVWYSPSIFHGPLVSKLKRMSGCKSYLIIRDIFPDWAVDMGLMSRGLPYYIFNAVARYQYSVADVIGVQAPGNRGYFEAWLDQPGRKLEVLQNWLERSTGIRCTIRVDETRLAERKVFVYAGNMGVAQGMDIFLDLAEKLKGRRDVGFLFVGRGHDAARLNASAQLRDLDNVVFLGEVDPSEIHDLYAQCHVGIVALDPRHKSHNIPGKFLTYMQSGLPVLANINVGNDLAHIIRNECVGQVCETNQVEELALLAEKLLKEVEAGIGLSDRCVALFEREFTVDRAVNQVLDALSVTGDVPS